MTTLFTAIYGHPSDPFEHCDDIERVSQPYELRKDGILLLNGGEDISPSIYGQKTNWHCHAPDEPSNRDILEMLLVDRARKMGMPIIGICRGAQLICALDGGTLLQHIVGHVGGYHALKDNRTGDLHECNSCHHQMMVPQEHNVILAIDDSRQVDGYTEENKQISIPAVPEIVYYPQMHALAIQGHPEWVRGNPFNKYCQSLIKEFLLRK